MKRFHLLAAGLFLLSALPAPAETPAGNPRPANPIRPRARIRLRFANTDFSDVIQALTLQTHANIVYPTGLRKSISVDVAADTTDQALSFITAASGLAFRQIGRTYVVAAPGDLRRALEPFGAKTFLPLNTLAPADAVKLLEGALPYLTVRQAGNQVLAIGGTEDIEQARTILAAQDKAKPNDPATTDVVALRYVPAAQVATLLKTMYPDLKAQAVGAADKPGGALGLAGPKSAVEGAKEALHTIDAPNAPRDSDHEYRVYPIRYSSAPVLRDFLEKSGLDVSVLIGPENYAPSAPGFRPLSGATIGTNNGGAMAGGNNGNGGGTAAGTGENGTSQSKPEDGSHARFLVLNGTPEQLDKAFGLLAQVDVPPQQVMVEVKVVDTSPERAEELGLTWSWTPFTFLEAHPGTTASDFDKATRPLGFGAISRVPWSFQSVLSAMTVRKEAKILADPRIQVVDNQDANIFIGETIRTQVSQSSLAGTTLQVL